MNATVSLRSILAATLVLACMLLPVATPGRDAAVRLPEELVGQSERIEFSGFGGFNKGSFTGGGHQGEFTRSESRLGVFDPLYVANRGKGSFTLRDSANANLISAECEARRNVATVKIVTLDVSKLTYECSFAETDERMTLGEPRRNGFREKLLAQDRRAGEAILFSQHLVIESIHRYDGSRLQSQAPLGYSLTSDGVAVAAVDLLDWNPIVHVRNDLSEMQRRAVIAAMLALAVLRDPAVSALEDQADLD